MRLPSQRSLCELGRSRRLDSSAVNAERTSEKVTTASEDLAGAGICLVVDDVVVVWRVWWWLYLYLYRRGSGLRLLCGPRLGFLFDL